MPCLGIRTLTLQVSHQPCVSAFSASGPGLQLSAWLSPQARFMGTSISAALGGSATLRLFPAAAKFPCQPLSLGGCE